MTHEEIEQLAALHAISAASAEEVEELRQHLKDCDDCRRAADELNETAALMALSVDAVPPPLEVRKALLREVSRIDRLPTLERPAPPPSSPWWLSIAAILLLALWGLTAIQLRNTQRALERERTDRAKLSETIAALSRSGTRTIQLSGQAVAPTASARVFLDPAQRRAFVFFNGLPANPNDKSYQLWIIRADQVAPQSAGVFNVDKSGNASLVVQNLPVETNIKALAVTLEPKGGVPSPTGEKYLVGM
ncbi:MAG TPA: anti-sigma factor [Thermoanaerobaculia bacterium]|jgi:anti-sigma-K factor RskA|nr:anti-sigma factor [Thermoanaerobaculia bacterium]